MKKTEHSNVYVFYGIANTVAKIFKIRCEWYDSKNQTNKLGLKINIFMISADFPQELLQNVKNTNFHNNNEQEIKLHCIYAIYSFSDYLHPVACILLPLFYWS